MTHEQRLAFRASTADLANLASIANALRNAGQPFTNRTDAVRYALAATARALTGK